MMTTTGVNGATQASATEGAAEGPKAAEGKSASTALATTNAERFRMALEPQSFDSMLSACELLAAAQITGCETPAAVLAKALAGRALGMGLMQSIVGIDIIKGQVSLRAKTKVALCLQSPICEYFRCTQSDAQRATWETKRVGQEPQSYTFTIEEARASGLTGRGDNKEMNNWDRFPAPMLRARASSYLADMVFPDVCKGMTSTEEALERRHDPNELEGEVVHTSPANVPSRNWAQEALDLTSEIGQVTPETPHKDRKALRERVIAWSKEAPEPYRTATLKAWNETPAAAKPAHATPPAAAKPEGTS